MASLEVGFSHDMFVELATETKNLVLFTERGQVLNSLFFFFNFHFLKYFQVFGMKCTLIEKIN